MANIVQAISIALKHDLTLLRHEDHEVIHLIKKGTRQLALAELEAEHAAMLAQVTAVLTTHADKEQEPAVGGSANAALPHSDDGMRAGATDAQDGASAQAGKRGKIEFGTTAIAQSTPPAQTVAGQTIASKATTA